MLTREWAAPPLQLPSATPAAPPVFPGLVSALRPIKRVLSQLSDEATLLRRFSYKNKNQHKGAGWWRHVMEVDRIMDRTRTELEGLLGEFGWSAASKEESTSVISVEAVVQGLLRLPRSALLLDKALSVLMTAAGILEPLIQSRAFLAFALVVVAINARLHALCMVLSLEMGSLGSLLERLVVSNKLSSTYESQLKSLPHIARKISPVSQPHPDPRALQASTSTLPPPSAPPLSDELGSIVARPMRPPPTTPKPTLAVPSARVDPGSSSKARPAPTFIPSRPEHKDAPIKPSKDQGLPTQSVGISLQPLKPNPDVPPIPKRTDSDPKDPPSGSGVRKKKKKKKKKSGDEIDDIFG